MISNTGPEYESLSALIKAADSRSDRMQHLNFEYGYLTALVACLKAVNESSSLREAANKIRILEPTK